jgi:hypothetical protein
MFLLAPFQAANRLIKNLVAEEGKRNERRAEIHSLIDRIQTSTSLLEEMLRQAEVDREVVDELAETCRILRNRLGGIGTETNEETESVLGASQSLEAALDLYEERKEGTGRPLLERSGGEGGAETDRLTAHLSLADELLLGLDLGTATGPPTPPTQPQEGLVGNLLDFDLDLGPTSSPDKEEEEVAEKKTPTLDEIGRMSRELMERSLRNSTTQPQPKK